MARAPKTLYWVDFDANGTKQTGSGRYGYRRHHLAPKGGKFSSLQAAKARVNELRPNWPDAIITILTTGPLSWVPVSETEQKEC